MDIARRSALPAEMPYMVLRAAQALFDKPPAELAAHELQQTRRQAQREAVIENRILNAPEASRVSISDEAVDRAVGEIRTRYADEASFQSALRNNDLDEPSLKRALARQCKVNAVLKTVAAGSGDVSDVDIALYYHAHLHTFQLPERREAYHILISINDDFPENTRTRARERIERIAERLVQKPKLFGELAQKNSECPTAMRAGRIGLVRRGQLYPALEEALFELRVGQISQVLESEMGFHLLLCKGIRHPESISMEKAAPQIRALLIERIQENRRRQWIANLKPPHAGECRS